nr:hypothetical protein [Tanacetum cinerariifolium]
GVATAVVVVRWWQQWRVEESDMDERVDRVTSNLFGFAGKIPPETFSGGGRGGRRRLTGGGRSRCVDGVVAVLMMVTRGGEGDDRGGVWVVSGGGGFVVRVEIEKVGGHCLCWPGVSSKIMEAPEKCWRLRFYREGKETVFRLNQK